jgi:hypothetical protein
MGSSPLVSTKEFDKVGKRSSLFYQIAIFSDLLKEWLFDKDESISKGLQRAIPLLIFYFQRFQGLSQVQYLRGAPWEQKNPFAFPVSCQCKTSSVVSICDGRLFLFMSVFTGSGQKPESDGGCCKTAPISFMSQTPG